MSLGDLFTHREYRWFVDIIVKTTITAGWTVRELVALFTSTRFVFYDMLGGDWGTQVLRHRPDMRFALRVCSSGTAAFLQEDGTPLIANAITTPSGVRFTTHEGNGDARGDHCARELCLLSDPGEYSIPVLLRKYGLLNKPFATGMLARIGDTLLRPGGTIHFSFWPLDDTEVRFSVVWTGTMTRLCYEVKAENAWLEDRIQARLYEQLRTLGKFLRTPYIEKYYASIIELNSGAPLFRWLMGRHKDPHADWDIRF